MHAKCTHNQIFCSEEASGDMMGARQDPTPEADQIIPLLRISPCYRWLPVPAAFTTRVAGRGFTTGNSPVILHWAFNNQNGDDIAAFILPISY